MAATLAAVIGLAALLTWKPAVDNLLVGLTGREWFIKGYTVAAVGGQQPPADLVKDTIDNGAMQVPTAKLDATLIHLEKGQDPGDIVQKAVDLGMFTWAQICTGAAAATETCKTKNK